MKVHGGRERKLCIFVVYDSTRVSVIDSSYGKLKEDVLRRKGLHFLEILMLE